MIRKACVKRVLYYVYDHKGFCNMKVKDMRHEKAETKKCRKLELWWGSVE